MDINRPIRVLHAFGSLGVGGLETWLMNILRLRSNEVKFDFYLGKLGGAYEAEARSYGCHIHLAPPIRQLGQNLRFLKEVLTTNQYDVFHVHGDEFLGDAVKVAAMAGVPVRIVHSHNTKLARGKKGFEMQVRAVRKKTLERYRILHHATDILACGEDAGRFLMDQYWEKDPRSKVLYCGVSLEQFNASIQKWNRNEYRKMHGIPEDAMVIGHVGSMGPTAQKNHPFILDIFAELVRKDKRYFLYLAGDGPHRPAIEKKVEEMGLRTHVKFSGLCDDVPSLMIHGFDNFLLPSLWEGLPVVGLEAVASGLFTVCSDAVTTEFTGLFSERVATVSLDSNPSVWADKIIEGIQQKLPPQEGIAIIEKTPFSIHGSLNSMLEIYKHRLENN